VTFLLDTFKGVTIRKNPTTQIAIRVREWPGNVFLLWLPESVSRLRVDRETGLLAQDSMWDNYTAGIADQDFWRAEGGGLSWGYEGHPDVAIEADLVPQGNSLRLEVRVTNRSDRDLAEVSAQNCLHLSAAPDFSCGDFTRIHIRSGGEWRALSSLEPTSGFPMYYRRGFFADGRPDRWGGRFSQYNQPAEADHPLIVCVSRDGRRAVGTASKDYQCVFHNSQYEYLRCIHSQQVPVRVLGAGERATFCQKIYFVRGGLMECVSACEADIEGDFQRGYSFRDRIKA
jgi:hypothetical protein